MKRLSDTPYMEIALWIFAIFMLLVTTRLVWAKDTSFIKANTTEKELISHWGKPEVRERAKDGTIILRWADSAAFIDDTNGKIIGIGDTKYPEKALAGLLGK